MIVRGGASWVLIARRFAAMPVLLIALAFGLIAEAITSAGLFISGEVNDG